jgi:hypothetical protein
VLLGSKAVLYLVLQEEEWEDVDMEMYKKITPTLTLWFLVQVINPFKT